MCSANEMGHSMRNFPFEHNYIKEGLKYLGFHLKTNEYHIKDWNWLITKVERRINIWHHRWLSWVCKLVLIKSVLDAIHVYWMSLAWLPKGVTNRI